MANEQGSGTGGGYINNDEQQATNPTNTGAYNPDAQFANYILRGNNMKDYVEDLLEEYGLPKRRNIDWCNKLYRFGLINPYDEMQNGREHLFFIKPDLFILNSNGQGLQPDLKGNPFFEELFKKWPHVIQQLQYRADPTRHPFSLLLSNAVTGHLDLPSLSAATISTPTNNFGTNYDYRGTSEASDDNFTFSIEFEDTKYLDVYMYFKAYEEYQIIKSQGRLHNFAVDNIYRQYIVNKVLHDQIGIYKFIVGEDMETILHYSYFCGVIWTSLPRDSFNSPEFDDGIRYAIDGKAAFVEDMNPLILRDFNNLVGDYNTNHTKTTASVYNKNIDATDLKPVLCPFVVEEREVGTGKIIYKLKFRR